MALTRLQLKSIIKECLFEILKEGLDAPVSKAVVRENKTHDLVHRSHAPAPRSSTTIARPAPRPQQGEDLLESIFKDTANTTLPKQMANEQRAPTYVPNDVSADEYGSVTSDYDTQQQVPPPGPGRWEMLAFMDVKGK